MSVTETMPQEVVRVAPSGELSLAPLIGETAGNWNELISGFTDRKVFHSTEWLAYLAQTRRLRIKQWQLLKGDQPAGYLCGGVTKKGPFTIFGSPLKGWGTNSLGPLMESWIETSDFLTALDKLALAEKFSLVELEKPELCTEALRAFGYTPVESWTYRVALVPDEDVMLKRMHKGRRYGINKATKSGLIAEEASDDAFADDYYRQFTNVMLHKGLTPPYDAEVPRQLLAHLRPAGKVLALRVRDNSGRCLATGIFPFDNQTIYYWGGASTYEDRKLCPNDFMHWYVMRFAAKRSMTIYDLSGWGKFKQELGGELITVRRWHKAFSPGARIARNAYQRFFYGRMRVLGWLKTRSREEQPE